MKDLHFSVADGVLALGVKVQTAQISGIKNIKTTKELYEYIVSELKKIKKFWKGKNYESDPTLLGFRNLHTLIGRSNRKFPASPEVLLRILLEKGRFPRVNSVVDIYNLVSLKTRLALGAHDIKYIEGNTTLRFTNGNEKFLPLGSNELVPVPAGEYAYVDDGNNIICRLEVLQVEPTKVTTDSEDIFLIIQGNSNTDSEYIQDAANEVVSLIKRFCGGEARFLNTLE